MSNYRVNYPYATINENNIVFCVSMFYSKPTDDNPNYWMFVPLSELDYSLIGMRYIGRDADGYGLFEPVPEPEEPEDTEPEQIETIAE